MQSYASPDWVSIPTSSDQAPRSRARFRPDILHACWIANVLCVVAICCLLSWNLHEWTEANAERSELRIVDSIAGDIRHDIESLDVAVTAAAKALQFPGIWNIPKGLREAVLFNAAVQPANHSTFRVIGADGWLQSVSNVQTPQAVNFGDQEYFVFHRTHSDEGVRISEPMSDRLDGSPMIILSKRVSGGNGEFAGVVAAGIDLAQFRNIFEKFDRGGGGVIALQDMDGRIVLRSPPDPSAAGISTSRDPGFRKTLNGPYTSISEFNGTSQLVAYRAIDGFPFAVSYGRATQEIFGEWQRISLGVAGTVVLLTGFQLLLIGVIRGERRHRAAAERFARLSAETLSGVNKDLEERINREIQSRKQTQEKLAKSQRLEALGQLAGGIAHDINNVLQTVSGACSLAQEYDPGNRDVQRLTAIALSAADRGSAVTQRLLLFARRAAIHAEYVDTTAVLNDLRELLSHTLCDSVTLQLDLADDLPEIWADRMQLETVIINLATNARDAMPDGGTITIRARVGFIEEIEAEASGLLPGRYVRLSVTDTGFGMDEKIMSRAAEPFFSTKGVGKGTGLGLSMAKGFAEQSDGKLEITSKVDEGTTVTLWMPAGPKPGTSDQGAAGGSLLQAGCAAGMRALLVDDNTEARELVGEGLAGAGLEVREAESGAAALLAIRDGLRVDFLLTDLSMPEMDGLQLIHEIRTILPDLPAILLTGNTGAVADLPIGDTAASRCTVLQKPIRMKELLGHIENLLRRTNAVSVSG